ncbi:MAG: O-methyltransferase [Lachnospiraceae bacterium]|jgi:predicted O-methyltransferase YrrM|nr:O-methyltransferase [Lachnospiraceae bacterium]MCR4803695.1 O-methyltransferase [Lachnospiraceae bacterium]
MIEDERIGMYIHSLDKELSEKLRHIEQEALANEVPIIKKPTQTLLQFLVKAHKPKHILEVGCAVGFSAILMNESQPEDGKITTIEKVSQRIEKAKENFAFAECCDRIELLEGDATDILKELVAAGKEYDMIFMDAAKGQYLNFFDDIIKLLKVDGLLVSDNVLQDGDIVESRYAIIKRNRTIHSRMRDYLYLLTHHEALQTVILPLGDGVTLSTKLK